jgi:cyclophilin family peptidyl-prolyl cis-trans isomerase
MWCMDSRAERWLLATLLLCPGAAAAQSLSAADSALVGRILVAEDRRDSTDAALDDGARHPDARVRVLAERARGRIRDPKFVARTALPPVPAPPTWPEPGWRLRLRALTAVRTDCTALGTALADSAWTVRLRATDLLQSGCAGDPAIVRTLQSWIDALPASTSTRRPGQVSWHPAAHAIVTLARLRPDAARAALPRLIAHPQWQVRQYATRAAGLLADTAALRRAARDAHDNVQEAAIEALSRLVKHEADDVYLAALVSGGVPAMRAAAVALKGSPRPDVAAAATRTFERVVARANASEWDTRHALLEAAGRPVSDDRPPPVRVVLPPDAIALALGADIRLRVTMDAGSGGGSFVVRLRGDVAPMMAGRLLALAQAAHYDGLTWHRVEHDFVIQGGSPGANEYVGLAQFLRDELGTVPHARGTLGMSTRGHDTGDAQWFVNLRDNLRLNGDYTVWAEVVEGIDVVDGVLEGDVIRSIRPLR